MVASKDFRFSDDDDDVTDDDGTDDDGIDGDDVDVGDIFASLLALFHKVFTLLRSSYR